MSWWGDIWMMLWWGEWHVKHQRWFGIFLCWSAYCNYILPRSASWIWRVHFIIADQPFTLKDVIFVKIYSSFASVMFFIRSLILKIVRVLRVLLDYNWCLSSLSSRSCMVLSRIHIQSVDYCSHMSLLDFDNASLSCSWRISITKINAWCSVRECLVLDDPTRLSLATHNYFGASSRNYRWFSSWRWWCDLSTWQHQMILPRCKKHLLRCKLALNLSTSLWWLRFTNYCRCLLDDVLHSSLTGECVLRSGEGLLRGFPENLACKDVVVILVGVNIIRRCRIRDCWGSSHNGPWMAKFLR